MLILCYLLSGLPVSQSGSAKTINYLQQSQQPGNQAIAQPHIQSQYSYYLFLSFKSQAISALLNQAPTLAGCTFCSPCYKGVPSLFSGHEMIWASSAAIMTLVQFCDHSHFTPCTSNRLE
jgi:hypothetical protein